MKSQRIHLWDSAMPSWRAPRRGAFTLVELLVAMAIIAVLGALIAAGVMSWIGSQARRNTENEIRTVHKALMGHWASVRDDAKKESIPQSVITLADNNAERAKILWIKIRLMEAFPVNFSEIKGAYATAPLAYIPAKQRRNMSAYQNSLPAGYTLAPPGKTESAACLLMAIGINRGGVEHNADMLRSFIRDTNNDKVLELVDGWGEPLYFYRFATGNGDVQASAPNIPPKDPIDQTGVLANWNGANATVFDTQVHPRFTAGGVSFAIPVVASAGPNLKFGHSKDGEYEPTKNLYDFNRQAPYSDFSVPAGSNPLSPTLPKPAEYAQDNLYSHKIK
jgi:prepilin-type N-terminal cleavage/methylation domain-containing protein